MQIFIPIIVLGGLGFIFAIGLAYVSKKFAVKIDPRMEEVENALAGINCGVCGYPGCRGYAEAIVNEGVAINKCAPGGNETLKKVAEIMGMEVEEMPLKVAVVRCQGGKEQIRSLFIYEGISDCRAAHLVCTGCKSCNYGCLGYGSCASACPFGAIKMNSNGLPMIDESKCTACGICVKTCPRSIITLIPKTQEIFLGCINPEAGPYVRRVCQVGCVACGLCTKKNPAGNEGIRMEGNLPVINYEKLTSWPEANLICPRKCYVTREAASVRG
ncbi:MAG: RnfABCDGE type electron transport complex subunit B [bacterium]